MKQLKQFRTLGEGPRNDTATHHWRGGHSGFERCWNHPANWVEEKVPGWRSHVHIDGHCRYAPVIVQPCDDITSLTLTTGAVLTVGIYGELTVDGLFDPVGSGLINSGHIRNYGELLLRNAGPYGLRNAGYILNAGMFFFDDLQLQEQMCNDPRFENEGEIVDLSC